MLLLRFLTLKLALVAQILLGNSRDSAIPRVIHVMIGYLLIMDYVLLTQESIAVNCLVGYWRIEHHLIEAFLERSYIEKPRDCFQAVDFRAIVGN
jgi:hypothetical protein